MRQYIGGTIVQKAYLLKSFAPKLPVPSVQWCIQCEYIVKARLGFAWQWLLSWDDDTTRVLSKNKTRDLRPRW